MQNYLICKAFVNHKGLTRNMMCNSRSVYILQECKQKPLYYNVFTAPARIYLMIKKKKKMQSLHLTHSNLNRVLWKVDSETRAKTTTKNYYTIYLNHIIFNYHLSIHTLP
jgi:hypothetical protein